MSKKRYRRIKNQKLLLTLAEVLMALVLIGGHFFAVWLIDNRLPAFERSGTIKVYPDMSVTELLEQIDSVLVPHFPKSIKRTLYDEIKGRALCMGSYKLDSMSTSRYLARAITRGWENPVNLTISGTIRTKECLAEKIASQLMVGKLSMLEALNDSLFLATLGTRPSRVFEIIIPDTYQIYWTSTPNEILERFKKEHDLYWNETRTEQARAVGLTPYQVSVLASIISEESNKADEYPKIASVYVNRLKRGMRLQACPTVRYIYGYKVNRVLYSHLKNPSPYNTYIYQGLPPTPIALPGKEHLEAVLHPDATPYLYFCADSAFNGRNVFSVSINEHIGKSQAYHDALDQRTADRKAAESDKSGK